MLTNLITIARACDTLETGASRAVTWLSGPGPSYVAVQP